MTSCHCSCFMKLVSAPGTWPLAIGPCLSSRYTKHGAQQQDMVFLTIHITKHGLQFQFSLKICITMLTSSKTNCRCCWLDYIWWKCLANLVGLLMKCLSGSLLYLLVLFEWCTLFLWAGSFDKDYSNHFTHLDQQQRGERHRVNNYKVLNTTDVAFCWNKYWLLEGIFVFFACDRYVGFNLC